MSNESDRTLRLERLIPMQPDHLFALWIEPAQLAKWWAPEGYEPSVHVLDSRAGGRWRVAMRGADGNEVATSGVYRIVEPPRRLSFYLGLGGRQWRTRPRNRGDSDFRSDARRHAACVTARTLRRRSGARQSQSRLDGLLRSHGGDVS